MFAGNDAIVAFARSQQVKVVIHQLNAPLWEVNTSVFLNLFASVLQFCLYSFAKIANSVGICLISAAFSFRLMGQRSRFVENFTLPIVMVTIMIV